jgi:acyl-CoA oxidase
MDSSNLNKILNDRLNSINRTTRNALSNCFKDEIFIPVYNISLREQKELALRRLQKVISTKMVSIRDFLNDPENIFTVHEMVNIFINLAWLC